MSAKTLIERLYEMQDEGYKKFQCALMPTVDENTVIGIRTPQLRRLAKDLRGTSEAKEFMSSLPHSYYEENNLHAFLIEHINNYGECIAALNEFLPCVDNWATCDSMTPKVLKKHLSPLLDQIKIWLSSNHTYTVRYGIKLLMCFYLDGEFSREYPQMVASVKSEEYYVKMMVAWYFATALAKQYSSILPYIENRILDPWTHNKAIQKAKESYRITDEQKEYLNTLKIKTK